MKKNEDVAPPKPTQALEVLLELISLLSGILGRYEVKCTEVEAKRLEHLGEELVNRVQEDQRDAREFRKIQQEVGSAIAELTFKSRNVQ